MRDFVNTYVFGSVYGPALAASLSFASCLPLLARLYSSTALLAERSDVSDAGNRTCFSLQPFSEF